MDPAQLRVTIDAAVADSARWNAKAAGFGDLADDELRAARDALYRLVDGLEGLVASAETASPVDAALVGAATRALRAARHNAVWAGYVLHQRLPPADPADLA